MAYALRRTYTRIGADYEILLDDAEVGAVYHDPHAGEQVIRCDAGLFPVLSHMPAAFRGCRETRVPRLGDVYRFFGIALPGAAMGSPDPDRALVQAAHDRGARPVARLAPEEAAA